MEKISVLIVYLIISMLTIEFAITLLGMFNHSGKGIVIGLISGLSDYVVRNLIAPYFHLFDGFHVIIGILLIIITCYFYLRVSIGASITICLLSYLVQGITEILMALIYMSIFGKQSMETHQTMLIYFAAIGQIIIILIPMFYLKSKKIKLIGSFAK